jgi:hypothetical protein
MIALPKQRMGIDQLIGVIRNFDIYRQFSARSNHAVVYTGIR